MKQSDYNEMTLRHDEQLKAIKALTNKVDGLQNTLDALVANKNQISGALSIGGIIVGCAMVADCLVNVAEWIGRWIHK